MGFSSPPRPPVLNLGLGRDATVVACMVPQLFSCEVKSESVAGHFRSTPPLFGWPPWPRLVGELSPKHRLGALAATHTHGAHERWRPGLRSWTRLTQSRGRKAMAFSL